MYYSQTEKRYICSGCKAWDSKFFVTQPMILECVNCGTELSIKDYFELYDQDDINDMEIDD